MCRGAIDQEVSKSSFGRVSVHLDKFLPMHRVELTTDDVDLRFIPLVGKEHNDVAVEGNCTGVSTGLKHVLRHKDGRDVQMVAVLGE